jgi:NAD(P)-dependent dehydrogenase (short-subunit alcohol dehydrogenase family)
MSTDTAATPDLHGRRILVVGSSSGLGRVIGNYLCEAGAHVGFAARRLALCEEAAKEAPGTAVGLGCDVTDPEACERVVAEAVERLGGLDDVVYAAGLTTMVALADADADRWRRTLDTNVVGASLVTRAALPHLRASGGAIVYLSSLSSYTGPWPGIGVYTASKAALNRMIETWQVEHPEVVFARVNLGPMNDGGTAVDADEGAFGHLARWIPMHLFSGALAEARSVGAAIALVLRDPSRIPEITVAPRNGPLPWDSAHEPGRGIKDASLPT